jgi:hypothetical protein
MCQTYDHVNKVTNVANQISTGFNLNDQDQLDMFIIAVDHLVTKYNKEYARKQVLEATIRQQQAALEKAQKELDLISKST